jgi:hypothetical protein
LIDGEPELSTIPDTNLLWVTNSEADLFLSSYDGRYYFLVSGRWFRADDLMEGPWSFTSRRLPPGFQSIPEGHPSAHVLASVPGTAQAEEAVILAQIPQTARIDRDDADAPEVRFHGDPEFETIPGTSVARAVNTSSDIIKVGDLYYLCFQAVWFRSAQPTGPWEVTGDVPDSVYNIPPESPSHHVTYVVVEDDDDDWVEFAVMAGYMGMYWASDWNCMQPRKRPRRRSRQTRPVPRRRRPGSSSVAPRPPCGAIARFARRRASRHVTATRAACWSISAGV